MRSRKLSYIAHKLKAGLFLRCPECERGKLFEMHFRMRKTCPYCEVRFERSSGDTIGGIYMNVALAELTAMIGFFLVHLVFRPPILHQLLIWIPYLLTFTVLFYPHARGLWVGVMYLTGGIYPDQDYQREYIASDYVRLDRSRQEHE